MARFKTIMIETGVAIVDGASGQRTINSRQPVSSKACNKLDNCT